MQKKSKVRSLAANGLGLGCEAFTATRKPEAAFAEAAATLISLPAGKAFADGAAFFEKARPSNDVADVAFDAGADDAAAAAAAAAGGSIAAVAVALASVRSGTVAAAVTGLTSVRSSGAATGLASEGRRTRSIAGGASSASVLSTREGAAVVVGASGVSAPGNRPSRSKPPVSAPPSMLPEPPPTPLPEPPPEPAGSGLLFGRRKPGLPAGAAEVPLAGAAVRSPTELLDELRLVGLRLPPLAADGGRRPTGLSAPG
eukprot:scaffold79676_cov51-Phaeocystis_antarctica.AAC.4